MNRRYKKSPLLNLRQVGILAFSLFLGFVAYRILTPPNEEIARIVSPDGHRIARLRKIYYVSQPSYKIDYKESDKLIWNNLLYLPSYTNVPSKTAVETLNWSPDSSRLSFFINDKLIWRKTLKPSPRTTP